MRLSLRLFSLLLGLCLLSCKPVRQLTVAQTPDSPTENASVLTVSTDTLPSLVNAAQTSEPLVLTAPTAAETAKRPMRKPSAFKTWRTLRKMQRAVPQDTSQLYKRRPPIDTRVPNKLAGVSLWTGIGSFVFLLLGSLNTVGGILALISPFLAIAAIVTGIVALSEIRRNPETYRGKGNAIAGLTLGSTYVFLGLLLLGIALIVLALF